MKFVISGQHQQNGDTSTKVKDNSLECPWHSGQFTAVFPNTRDTSPECSPTLGTFHQSVARPSGHFTGVLPEPRDISPECCPTLGTFHRSVARPSGHFTGVLPDPRDISPECCPTLGTFHRSVARPSGHFTGVLPDPRDISPECCPTLGTFHQSVMPQHWPLQASARQGGGSALSALTNPNHPSDWGRGRGHLRPNVWSFRISLPPLNGRVDQLHTQPHVSRLQVLISIKNTGRAQT